MPTRRTRAVSTVLATVLLVAIVLGGVATIAALSAETLDDRTGEITRETARADLGRIGTGIERVAYTGRRHRSVGIGDGLAVGEGGRVRIAVGTPGRYRTVLNTSLGRVGVETNRGTLAYQAGGIFRKRGSSSSVVRAPPLTVLRRNTTAITFPVFTVDGDRSLADTVRVRLERQRDAYGRVSAPPGDRVRITIRSSFVDAWARTLRHTVPTALRRVETTDERVTAVVDGSDPLYLHVSAYDVVLDDR